MNNNFSKLVEGSSPCKTVAIFGFTGTLMEFDFDTDHSDLVESLDSNPYSELRILPLMEETINSMYENGIDVKVLTRIESSPEFLRKAEYLSEHFEKFNTWDCIGVTSTGQRLQVLSYLEECYDCVIYVDSDLMLLAEIRRKFPEVEIFHTSSLFS